MLLEYTDGCICSSLAVDGIESTDMGVDNFRKVIHHLYDLTNNKSLLRFIFENLVMSQGKYFILEYDKDNIFGDVAVHTISFGTGNDYPRRNDPHFTYINYNYDEVCIVDKGIWNFEKSDVINNRIHSLIDREEDISVLQSIFCKFLEYNGNYKCSSKACDCCGDYIRTWRFQI